MDHAGSNQDTPTTGHYSFGQPSREEANQLGTPKRAVKNTYFDMEDNSPDIGSGHLMVVDNSNDCDNNASLDDSVHSPAPANFRHHARAPSNDSDKQPCVDDRFSMLLRAPMKRRAVGRNMDRTNKVRRRPRCGRSLFGIDKDALIDADGNEIAYQAEQDVPITPLVDQFLSPKLSEDDNVNAAEVEMSARPAVCVPLPCMDVSSQCNSSDNSNVDNCHSTNHVSNNDVQTECDKTGKDLNDVNDRIVEVSIELTEDQGYSRGQASGSPSQSPVSSDDNGNLSGLAVIDSDDEQDRPRLLPEHYVAPRRQRRLPPFIRARLPSMQGRRLSFNTDDDESDNQEAIPKDANRLHLPHDSSSPRAFCPSSEPRLSNENARRRLFDDDSKSLRKSFYTIIQSHDNSRLSNHIDVATIQSILDTVFGSTRSDNSCPKQSRLPHNTSFSDDDEDLASSDDDCNDANDCSDNDSSDLSSEEEYVDCAVESVYFLPKSQLPVFDVDVHSTSLYSVANEDNDNLGNCAVESYATDDDNSALHDSADEGCKNVNDSEEETFTELTLIEEYLRSPRAGTPPFSPFTSDYRSSLRAEDDSDAEYNRHRLRPEQCAAPRRQRRLPASRRSRPSPLSRRRLCFDDSDDESSNQRAVSEDGSVVSQSDTRSRSSLLFPSNKYLYALVPPHNQSGQSSQVDIASILSILNSCFDASSRDNRSSSQSNVSNNSPSENETNQSVDQPSLATDSARLLNNDIHDSSEDDKQTESPSHPRSPGDSDDSSDEDLAFVDLRIQRQ